MLIADYHTHSSFSEDSEEPMEKMIISAINLGLKEIAFTDHLDYDYADTEFTFLLDINAYAESFEKLKNKYKDKIKLLSGVEIGLQPHLKEKNINFSKSYNFDFIIASTHTTDRKDFYNGDFFIGKTQKNAYLRYFEDVLENILIHRELNFNVYGHLDYINRYGNYDNKILNYMDFKNLIDEILKTLISCQKGIELNTSGFRYGLNQTHPQPEILKRYKELGGEILTVGSDAHKAADIFADFDKAYEIIKSAGFNYITLFEQQKPRFEKI